jgi:glucokinase
MEVGHLIVEPGGRPCGCGNHGCLEQYASATAVRRAYGEAAGETVEAVEVARRAREGDARAHAAFSQAGAALGFSVAHLAKVLDVADVVIGGGLSSSWDLMASSFDRRLERDLLPVLRGKMRVRRSDAQDRAGMIGAAHLALL